MNCREAQSQIFAESDGAPEANRHAALEGHLAHCGDCRRVRDDLTAALAAWRADASRVAVPDVEREWHAVRRQMRGGAEAGAARSSRPRRNLFSWIVVPVGAAAALALTLFMTPRSSEPLPGSSPTIQMSRADSVDAPGNNASTMVFVDDKSGWLIVWASDAQPKQG